MSNRAKILMNLLQTQIAKKSMPDKEILTLINSNKNKLFGLK